MCTRNVCTYSLCGGLWCHAVFADSQFKGVFDTCLQLGARDSKYWTAGAQAEVQTGAVLWTLQEEIGQEFYECFVHKMCYFYIT